MSRNQQKYHAYNTKERKFRSLHRAGTACLDRIVNARRATSRVAAHVGTRPGADALPIRLLVTARRGARIVDARRTTLGRARIVKAKVAAGLLGGIVAAALGGSAGRRAARLAKGTTSRVLIRKK